jgi:hypothetical protein
LLALALVSGNAHAELHLNAVPHDPCPAALGHAHGHPTQDHHQDRTDHNCCCDCLGCASAIELTPDLTSFLPVFLASSVLYGEENARLAGQVLRPEPGPPRPGSLS